MKPLRSSVDIALLGFNQWRNLRQDFAFGFDVPFTFVFFNLIFSQNLLLFLNVVKLKSFGQQHFLFAPGIFIGASDVLHSR